MPEYLDIDISIDERTSLVGIDLAVDDGPSIDLTLDNNVPGAAMYKESTVSTEFPTSQVTVPAGDFVSLASYLLGSDNGVKSISFIGRGAYPIRPANIYYRINDLSIDFFYKNNTSSSLHIQESCFTAYIKRLLKL